MTDQDIKHRQESTAKYQTSLSNMTDRNRINNTLITYAYNRLNEIEQETRKAKNDIVENSPSSTDTNKSLNLSTAIDSIATHIHTLQELEVLSTKIYRSIHQENEPLT